MNLTTQLAKELQFNQRQIEQTIKLLDEGNTIPFIARYRKEATGELDEVQIRTLADRLTYLRNLENRQQEIRQFLTEQEKLTPELEKSINEATTLQQLEDIYRPFRPKRRTRASIAKEKGLEPLAQAFMEQSDKPPELLAEKFINEEVTNTKEAIQGALDILAEMFADNISFRQIVRHYTWNEGILTSNATDDAKENNELLEFKMYFEYEEPIRKIPPHRVLAINRGEKLKALKVKIQIDPARILTSIERKVITDPKAPVYKLLKQTIEDCYQRLLSPSIEREIRNNLTEKAEEHATTIFAKNLRNLIMQSPVRGRILIGIDPAYRTGCKVVVINNYGDLLDTITIYPHEPQNQWQKSIDLLNDWVSKYQSTLITIGNGTASRETEQLVAELITKHQAELQYLVINESGASVYSASDLARKEFPNLDVSMRGAVSIARRVQDPLAEFVKIDPKSIGVGLYQHDVNQKQLAKTLGDVVESCVNFVGVELNSASAALLKYVAGLSMPVANEVIAYRQSNNGFEKRGQLKEVKGLGPKTFQQCAGFLRIADGEDPLDNTAVHPESYKLAREILKSINYSPKDLQDKDKIKDIKAKLKTLDSAALAKKLDAGEPTIRDILNTLAQPGRDPRDELPPPLFRADVLTIEDLKPGMILKGTVQNVVDFGAFIDIGVKKAGLVHISEISDHFIKHPTDVLQVGDIVHAQVLSVEPNQGRISLTLKLRSDE